MVVGELLGVVRDPQLGEALHEEALAEVELVIVVRAALEVEHGEGRVILLGMKPQWRGQPFGTFKVLFNATLYSKEVASQTPDNSAFWIAPEEDEDEGGEGNSNDGRR